MEKISSNRVDATTPIVPADGTEVQNRAKGVQDHEAGFRVKLILRRVKRRFGHVHLSARIRAHDPKLLDLSERMNRHTAATGAVPTKLKELVQLKVAAMVGCPF